MPPARWPLIFTLLCSITEALAAGSAGCGQDGLETSMLLPRQTDPLAGRYEGALLFRNCSDHAVKLVGAPVLHFYLSAAGAARLEDSGPATIMHECFDCTPGRPATLALSPGQQAEAPVFYYDRARDSDWPCGDADVAEVGEPPQTRVFRLRMHVCGPLHESAYRLAGNAGPDAPWRILASAAVDRQTDIGVRPCEAADLDIRFDPPDRSVSPTSIALHFQNITGRACRLFTTPSVGFRNGSRDAEIPTYDNCTAGRQKDPWKIILPAQGTATTTLSFKTEAEGASECRKVTDIQVNAVVPPNECPGNDLSPHLRNKSFGHEIRIWLGAAVLPICGRLDAAPATLEAAAKAVPASASGVTLKVTTDKSDYYAGVPIPLHITIEGPSELLPTDAWGRVPLMERKRTPDGSTWFEPVTQAAARDATGSAAKPGFRRVEIEVPEGGGPGENTVELAYMAQAGKQVGNLLARSDIVHLNIAKPAARPWTWGARVDGVAVDLALGKDTYELGEKVPMHIAVANFAAQAPVYGYNPRWDPCWVVRIEVRDDADGQLVTGTGSGAFCTGHGWAAYQYPAGEILPLEVPMHPPNRSGRFHAVAVWTPSVGAPVPEGTQIVVRSAPQYFRIVDSGHSEAQHLPIQE